MAELLEVSAASVAISDEESDGSSSSDADSDADQMHQPFVQQCMEAKGHITCSDNSGAHTRLTRQ